jgi:hypothetical protein
MYCKSGSVDLMTYGWSRIWLTTGLTLAIDSRSSKLSTEKLDVSFGIGGCRMNVLGNTDRLDFALFVQFLHLLPGTWDIALGDIGVMDEVEIDILDAELLQRLFTRLSGILVV